MNKVTIVIVTYNGIKWISKCLSSIAASGCENVIIVDNGSDDGTISFVGQAFPSYDLIKSAKNLGFGAANNLGIQRALERGAEYIFLLNQDAYLEKNTLAILLEEIKKDERIGILSPLHLDGSASGFDKNFLVCLNNGSQNEFTGDLYFNRLQDFYFVPMVNAAGWFLTRKCIEQVGLFDPLFFHYGEDENYCHRVLYHGFKIGVTPKSVILHDREDRKGDIRPEFASEEKLRQLLVRLSNPFNDTKKELSIVNQRNRRSMLKFLFTLDLKNLQTVRNEYQFIKLRRKEVLSNTLKNRNRFLPR